MLKFFITQQRHYITGLFKLFTAYHSYNTKNVDLRVPLRTANTGSSKKMDGISNRCNLKSTGRFYTFGVLKCSQEFKVLDLP